MVKTVRREKATISSGRALINNVVKLVLPHQADCAMKGAFRMRTSLHGFDGSTSL
jgi:hypothetical protein